MNIHEPVHQDAPHATVDISLELHVVTPRHIDHLGTSHAAKYLRGILCNCLWVARGALRSFVEGLDIKATGGDVHAGHVITDEQYLAANPHLGVASCRAEVFAELCHLSVRDSKLLLHVELRWAAEASVVGSCLGKEDHSSVSGALVPLSEKAGCVCELIGQCSLSLWIRIHFHVLLSWRCLSDWPLLGGIILLRALACNVCDVTEGDSSAGASSLSPLSDLFLLNLLICTCHLFYVRRPLRLPLRAREGVREKRAAR
mmetsp:Transcript_60121/g.113474  ORF Transcript_60121/g.113474 Transcript_60121/m.113474 type:complete len:258 (-) Transcript_60121:51-824(-)